MMESTRCLLFFAVARYAVEPLPPLPPLSPAAHRRAGNGVKQHPYRYDGKHLLLLSPCRPCHLLRAVEAAEDRSNAHALMTTETHLKPALW